MNYQDKPDLSTLVSAYIHPDESDLDELTHYGVKRRSGRYPWGSGDTPYQHSGDFISRVEELRKSGFTYTDPETGKTYKGDTAIAKYMDMSTTEYRAYVTIANNERREERRKTAISMREDGHTLKEIADRLGYPNDSSVRALLNEKTAENKGAATKIANELKRQLEQYSDERGLLDVGHATELYLNVSKEKLNQALIMLEAEGYRVWGGGVAQTTNPGKQTNLRILCPPGTEHKEIYDTSRIHQLDNVISKDGGETFEPAFVYPASLDSKRLKIRYADEVGPDGHMGVEADGIIELRRGVKDLDLGKSNYAQVRIMVDDTHYLKGMAVYSDHMPDGVDVVFNTNKKSDVPMMDVLKKKKADPDNPFGALLKEHGGQSYYDDPNGTHIDPVTGKKQSLSLINKTREEGDWGEWSKNLPSQFLSKQNKKLIDTQLEMSIADKKAEYDEICALTNPTVKRELLSTFSEDCDSAAVKLKAASLPRQAYQVIIPVPGLKDTEVYAPNYKDGEKIALVRFPHGGLFEIPILTVNNRSKAGKERLGTSPLDAVGINSKNAERLSGADFDGDTVLCIPCNSPGSRVHISNKKPLEDLVGFDSKSYKYDSMTVDADGTEHYFRNGKEFRKMKNTQNEMGQISNLITDMTIKGADEKELARAVKHSMVVIDAEKHGLDYKQSYLDNGIKELKDRYQGHYNANGKWSTGANTLISQASAKLDVPKRKGSARINQVGKPWYDPSKPEGALIYKDANETYTKTKTLKNGTVKTETFTRMQSSTRMAETDDARTLSSGHPVEEAYAKYANAMKALANTARKEMISTPRLKQNASAKITYSAEVESLKQKLVLAEKNAPRERQAQIMAKSIVEAKKQEYPELRENTPTAKKELKKMRQKALIESRIKVGAKRVTVDITDREWEAIQAGAISDDVLSRILKKADSDRVRELATPRASVELSTAKVNMINSMRKSGYTNDEIATRLGISTTAVNNAIKGKE